MPECAPFLDSLFKALRSQSYLPYSTDTPSASTTGDGIPIPIEAYLPPTIPTSPRRKRGLEDDGSHRPSKGPRLSEDGNFARFPGGGDAMNGYAGMGYSNGRQGYQPPPARRGICRDYHSACLITLLDLKLMDIRLWLLFARGNLQIQSWR